MIRKDFFQNEDAHAVALGVACHKLLGEGWIDYESRTVYEELSRLGYGLVSESNANKINAFRVAKKTIMPWVDHESFEKVVHGLCGNLIHFEMRTPLSIAQCMVGVDMLRAIQQVPFVDDVKRYIAACAKNDELDYVPEPLSFIMPYLCPNMYECLDCGNVDDDDLEDGQCDVCTGRYEDGTVNGRPEDGLEDRGFNIRKFEPYSYAKIASDFSKVSRMPIDHVKLDADRDGIQLAMLLSYSQYREDYQFRMNQQLREVVHARSVL
jgi:hypothetical protein